MRRVNKKELLIALLCINGFSVKEAKMYIKHGGSYVLGRSGPGRLYLEDAICRCIERGGCRSSPSPRSPRSPSPGAKARKLRREIEGYGGNGGNSGRPIKRGGKFKMPRPYQPYHPQDSRREPAPYQTSSSASIEHYGNRSQPQIATEMRERFGPPRNFQLDPDY
jgi:hypothetical protein